jgi:hypothetical protein
MTGRLMTQLGMSRIKAAKFRKSSPISQPFPPGGMTKLRIASVDAVDFAAARLQEQHVVAENLCHRPEFVDGVAVRFTIRRGVDITSSRTGGIAGFGYPENNRVAPSVLARVHHTISSKPDFDFSYLKLILYTNKFGVKRKDKIVSFRRDKPAIALPVR